MLQQLCVARQKLFCFGDKSLCYEIKYGVKWVNVDVTSATVTCILVYSRMMVCIGIGTDEERGLAYWRSIRNADTQKLSLSLQQKLSRTYDLPFGMPLLQRSHIARHIPFLPTFGQPAVNCRVIENVS